MTTLPTLFVVAFLLVILAASNHRHLMATSSGQVFGLVIYINAFSMVLIGLRWSRDMMVLLPIAAMLAVISSALLYLAFCSLGRRGPVVLFSRDWVHLLPVALVATAALTLPVWLDIPLILVKLLYTVLLVRLASQAPDTLQLVRLSWLKNAQQALFGAATLLLVSLAVDVAIAIDFAFYDGRHAANLVGLVGLLIILLLGWVAVLAGRGGVSDTRTGVDAMQQSEVDDALSTLLTSNATTQTAAFVTNTDESFVDDSVLLDTLNKLLIDDQMYADTELNLQRLARKAGVPARTVSRVINALTGQNMSQWVNSARIDATCSLLSESDISVSQAMLDAGFLTKSNFNREFRRIKGCSPSEWRESL